MKITFRSRLFGVSDHERDERDGEDLAIWLAERLSRWNTFVVGEDWGWALAANRGEQRFLFGVYDHDTYDEDDAGALWVIRIYNERKSHGWVRRLFERDSRLEIDAPVVEEIVGLLKAAPGITDIQIAPSDELRSVP